MATALSDFRHALRVLSRHKAFTLAALSVLTLAIGANIAIFTLVSDTLLRPLPLPDPARLVRIEEKHAGRPLNLTGATFVDLRQQAKTLTAVAAYRLTSPGFSTGSLPEQVTAAEVSADYFDVLRVTSALGRPLDARDAGPGSARAVVVSDGLWRRRFGGDSGAVGRRVLVNAVPTELVGVMPAGFYAPGAPDIWIAQSSGSQLLSNRRAHLYTVIARMADDATLESTRSQIDAAARAIASDSGNVDPDLALVVTPLQDRLVQTIRPALLMLWGAVGLLLITAAANLANLLLMQASRRSRELSIRAALGASRWRLVRQLGTESLLLGLAGGVAGTIAGALTVPVLRAAILGTPGLALPSRGDSLWMILTGDTKVLAFAAVASLVTAIAFGIAPALRGSGFSIADPLRDRTGDTRSQFRARNVLVVVEVALTVMLLSGAGLLARSFLAVVTTDLGVDTSHAIALDFTLPPARYPDAAAHAAFSASVLERIAALPGVAAAGVTGALPMTGTPATGMVPEGSTSPDPLSADVVTASPGLFTALRIPLRSGRLFTSLDARNGAPVMLVNVTAARRFWPDGSDPVGRFVTMQDWGTPYRAQVVGVVGDVRQAGPDSDIVPVVYYPIDQFPETLLRNSLVIRTTGDPRQIVGAAREQFWAVDPDQPVAAVRTMDDVLRSAVSLWRVNLQLVAAFAIAALLLAAVGIYTVVAFAVASRAREIGVRVALGARPADIVRHVLEAGAWPIGLGVVIGVFGGSLAARLFSGLLHGVPSTDAITLAAVSSVVILTGVVACAGPVRRALQVDPVDALRSE
jgi:putative ABC transport system permease protein